MIKLEVAFDVKIYNISYYLRKPIYLYENKTSLLK